MIVGDGYSQSTLIRGIFSSGYVKDSFDRVSARDRYLNSIRGTEDYDAYCDYAKGLRKGFNKWFDKHWETESITVKSMEYMEDIKVKTERINHYIRCGIVDAADVDPCANLYINLISIAESDRWLRKIAEGRVESTLIKAVQEMLSGLSIWLKCCGYSDYEALEIIRGRFDLDYKYAEWYNDQGYIWYSDYGCAYIVQLNARALSNGRTKVKTDLGVCVDLNIGDNKLLRVIPVVAPLKD